ncbi:MAG: hypothetical protein FIB07_05725 [Candidatus Methanoperedens sp.]|nr:hypothetical protein [Candidatus Methanoperedens sp.]
MEHTVILFQIPGCCALTRGLANRNYSRILKKICKEADIKFNDADPMAVQDILIKLVQEQRPDVWQKVEQNGLSVIMDSFPVVVMDGKIISLGKFNEDDMRKQILSVAK